MPQAGVCGILGSMSRVIAPAEHLDPRYPHDSQLDDETAEEFVAWVKFRDMGPHRTAAAVAAELGQSPSTLVKYGKKNHWRERLANYLAELRMRIIAHHKESFDVVMNDLLDIHCDAVKRIKTLLPNLKFPDGDLFKATKAMDLMVKNIQELRRGIGMDLPSNVMEGVKIDANKLSDAELEQLANIHRKSTGTVIDFPQKTGS